MLAITVRNHNRWDRVAWRVASKLFWGLVIVVNIVAFIVFLLLLFDNFSVVYWYFDAIDSVLQLEGS